MRIYKKSFEIIKADQICDTDSEFVEKMKQSSGCTNDALKVEVDETGHEDSVVGIGNRFGLAWQAKVHHSTHTHRIAESPWVNL